MGWKLNHENLTRGKRNALFLCMRKRKLCFSLVFSFFIFYFSCILDSGRQKLQVIVTTLDHCCMHSRGVLQSLDCQSFFNVWGKMMENDDDSLWLMMLMVCETWAGGRCWVAWRKGFLFVWQWWYWWWWWEGSV